MTSPSISLLDFIEIKWFENPQKLNEETVEDFLNDDPDFVSLTEEERALCEKNQSLYIVQVYQFSHVGFMTFGGNTKELAAIKCANYFTPTTPKSNQVS